MIINQVGNCEPKLFDKDDYYKDLEYVSYSGLRVFSKCETLYRDMFVTKIYEEPDHEYFIYGKLVDAMITENKQCLEDNFIMVERKSNIEDALKFENNIKELKIEIESLKPKVEKGNQVAIKGVAKREKEIAEYQARLEAIKNIATKQQITPAMWREAEATALAIKTHPFFQNMEFTELTSQQVFTCEIDGTKRKGKLDFLKLSPKVRELYGLYKANMIDFGELQKQLAQLDPRDKSAKIIDVKTCYSIQKLEPWHYRGQLKMYQDLVAATLLIPIENIECYILAGDKVTNNFKMAELFLFTQKALDEIAPDIEAWIQKWDMAMKNKIFVSDKQKNGMDQSCFTCSDCRFCPLSQKPGDPVVINQPRFKQSEAVLDTSEVIME